MSFLIFFAGTGNPLLTILSQILIYPITIIIYDAGEKLLNRFIFQDKSFDLRFSISPQADLPLHINGSAISVYAGGTLSNNTYKWFKVNSGLQTTVTGDSVFHPSTAGSYYAMISNTRTTHLKLKSDTVNYTVPGIENSINTAKKTFTPSVSTEDKVTIYPNPVKDVLNFTLANNTGNAAILIYDMNGKILSQTEQSIAAGNNISINTAKLSAGSYFIHVLMNGKEFTKQFIKE